MRHAKARGRGASRPARTALAALAALAAGAAALAGAAPAAADWPVARHDARRTGASTSASNIQRPASYWRAYLGGALSGAALHVGDTDEDAKLDVLYVSGGRLLLARPDGQLLWRTPSLGFQTIAAVANLDLAGPLEVVVLGAASASLVNGKTGDVLWRQSPAELGTLTAARLADLSGDGVPDLFLDRCGCCGVETTSPGVVYSFTAGLGAPVALPPPPSRPHCGAAADTVGDWDGDGVDDLLVAANDTVILARGDGVPLGESTPIGLYMGSALCEAADIDGVPGDEAICVLNTVINDLGARRVFAITYRAGQSPPVQVLWEAALAQGNGGDLRAPGRLAWDLDGDGDFEVLVSARKDDAWTMYVLDAATGVALTSAGAQLAKAVVPDPLGAPWIVTSEGDLVSVWRYVELPGPSLDRAWIASDREVPTWLDRVQRERSSLGQGAVAPDLDGDGRGELILATTSEPERLHAYDVASGAPRGSYPLGVSVGVAALTLPQATGGVRLAVSRDDGYIALLDAALETTNLAKEGNDVLPGMRAGTYFTGPGGLFDFGRGALSARLQPGAAAESVLVVDSRGDLVRFDAAGASNVSPAKPTFRVQDASGAAIALAPGGGPARIGAFRLRHPVTEPPQRYLAVIDDAGAEIVDVPLAKSPRWDALPGDLDGDGAPDFAAITLDATNATDVIAVRATGEPLWQAGILAKHGTQPGAIADWNQDGRDDVAIAINTARVYSGQGGAVLADSGGFLSYFMPLLADVTGDGVLEMTLQGGQYAARTLTHDLSFALWQGPGDSPYPYGAIAQCPDAVRLIEGSLAVTARLAITRISGPQAGQRVTLVLAGGEAYPDEGAAQAAGAELGQLTDIAVSPSLSGDATPTALIGSSDGNLYAIDPCAAALRWSHAFDAPLSSPILADTDGDGNDDILVSAADGYLYGLREELVPAPEFVWDIDLPGGQTDADIDAIETLDTLHVAWAEVPGATSYEVAIVGAEGTYLTSPPWIDVGLTPRASVGGLPLIDGAKYYAGVRAVSAKGRSPDRPSDGLLVKLLPGGAGGGGAGGGGSAGGSGGEGGRRDEALLWGRGCSCRVAGRDPAPTGGIAWLSTLAIAALRTARRRGRPRPPPGA